MIAPVEVAAVLATVTDTPSRWTIAPRWGNWKWSGRGRLVFIITQAAPPSAGTLSAGSGRPLP
jgi:hypothetical protein